MKRALWIIPVILVAVGGWLARGSYSYFSSQALYPANWSGWTISGTVSSSCYGSYCGGYGGGMISTTSGSAGEAKITVGRNASAAYDSGYGVYFNPSGIWSVGFNYEPKTYFVGVQLYCDGTGGVIQTSQADWNAIDGRTVTYFGVVGVTCSDSMAIRAIAHGTQMLVYLNDALVLTSSISSGGGSGSGLAIGFPYVTGSRITNVDLGYLDTTAPNAISSSSIGQSAYINHVDLSWPAGTDDTNGSGIYKYEVWRNGSFLASTFGLSFSDTTVNPSTTYTYSLKLIDYHGNAATTNFNVTTPYIQTSGPFPSATPEGRRVGVRATGAYWGASGENIDVMSGNLNFTLPLVKAQARSGWGVGFNLNYNSQNWRYDSGGNWKFGGDVGYGFGWRLLAGSITPVFSDPWTVSYYLFTDSTGAEYRLDQNSGGIWSSKESIYLYYDASTLTLHFRDGSFWYFGCISASTEADSGVMYPTLMEDANGNQVLVRYQTSPGATWGNSSARITEIEDVRTPSGSGPGYKTYSFTYSAEALPHLTGITNTINTGENYSFNVTGQALSSPFNSQSYGTTAVMTSVTVTGNSTYHAFTYNGSGELTKILLPYKGYLRYDYTTATYSSSRSYREVIRRYLSKDGTSETQYSFAHESSPGPDVHQFTKLDDPGGVGEKYWAFATSGLPMGLVTQYQGRELPGPVTKTQNDYTWTQDSVGNSYIASATTTADPGQSYAAAKKTEQTVDTYGNVTQVKTYDFGNLTTPVRTDNFTYLNSSYYTSRYIFNRVATTPTATISYDQFGLGTTPGDARQWDSSVSPTYRGNATTVSSPSGTQYTTYTFAGGVLTSNTNGLTSSVSTTNATNYAAPSQVSVASTSATMSYSSFLGLTNETDQNGAQATLGYDAMTRPNSGTSPFGATTTNSYSDTSSPPTATTTTNGRWTKTTKDGLGRTIKVETGYSSTTLSVAETEYDSCGCSPLGKMKRTALPHAQGAAPVWTTYTYDGIGRTLTVVTSKESSPDTVSSTNYLYEGQTVKVTDATGKWKKYTTDALGQLTQVNEPNPAGGSDYVTTYAYDTLGHLTGVSMPRPTGTQTRTFNYGTPPGGQLLSATNPENGTVTYTYNSDKTLATKTDAKSQQVQYSYDSYKRVTQIRRGTYSGGTFTEDTCQREDYSYDTNPYDGSFSAYATGHLAAIQYKGGSSGGNIGGSGTCNTTFTEMYSYKQAGAIYKKRLRITRPLTQYTNTSADLDVIYTYDNEGRVTATQYPSSWNGSSWVAGPNLGNTFDSMGRLQTLTDLAASSDIISATSYSAAGQLLSMTGANGAPSESRTYNSIGQLTQLQSGGLNIQYAYSTTQNNGKITSETDVVSGEQITYTYDSLNRLSSATSSVNPGWGQSYAYDGFGNLTTQTVTKGTAPSLSVSYDPATNRQTGESADANGNICTSYTSSCPKPYTYDVENRIMFVGGSPTTPVETAYSYAPGNKRVWRGNWSGYTQTVDEVTFWGANGQKLTTYSLSMYGYNLVATSTGSNYYFGGKLVKNTGGYVTPDRLGSIGKYFPYGQERPSATTDGTDKFATYFRDSETGLDYADQRYHQPGMGRFMTVDPSDESWDSKDPGSWNQYAYALGDPANLNDPEGTDVNIPIQQRGGSPTSCLNYELQPWLKSHGMSVTNNFGQFANTATGILALTLYYEDTQGSSTLYSNFAQVMANRYWLDKSNPTLAKQLGLPMWTVTKNMTTDTQIDYVVEHSSNAWSSAGNLNSINDLKKLLDFQVVGTSNGVGKNACDHLLSAMNVAYNAMNTVFKNQGTVGAGLNNQTYWFFNSGQDPVNHNFWNTTSYTVPGSKLWTFERYISPKAPKK